MDKDQAAKFIIEAIPILRSQRKRPDRINIAKFVASKHGLSESVINETVAALLTDAVIYNKPNKRGDESLYVSKGSAEALSIIETDDEEEEGMVKAQPHETQDKSGKKQNRIFTNDLPSMEDPVVIPKDTISSTGKAMPHFPISEIIAPDTHILQEPDNSTLAYGDPIVIPTDTPQLIRKAPSHTTVPQTTIPDTHIASRADTTSTLAQTITKLADSVSILNKLLQKEREKNERLLCDNLTLKTKNLEMQSFIDNKTQAGTSPKGNDHAQTKKAMEIRTSLINDAERFNREKINENKASNERQIATEIKTNQNSRPVEEDRNRTQTALGKNKGSNNNSKNRSEQHQSQAFQQGTQTPNNTNNKSTNKTGKDQHPGELSNKEKKFKVLIVGDSQLRRVDESKLSNSRRDVEKRFQPGMRIGQAVEKTGKSNSDVIIVHAATNNVASSTPEKLCEETVRTLKQIQANNPKAKVAFSSIFKRKDNMALNNKVKKVNELLETELALNGLDMIDNSNIMFSNLWDDGLHINDGGIRKFSGNISSFIKYC